MPSACWRVSAEAADWPRHGRHAMGIQADLRLLDRGIAGMEIADAVGIHHGLAVDQGRQEQADQQQENTGNPDRPVAGSARLRVHACTVSSI